MAEGLRREQWDHTAHLLAMIANANRDPRSAAFHPRDFHPYLAPVAVAWMSMADLCDAVGVRPGVPEVRS